MANAPRPLAVIIADERAANAGRQAWLDHLPEHTIQEYRGMLIGATNTITHLLDLLQVSADLSKNQEPLNPRVTP